MRFGVTPQLHPFLERALQRHQMAAVQRHARPTLTTNMQPVNAPVPLWFIPIVRQFPPDRVPSKAQLKKVPILVYTEDKVREALKQRLVGMKYVPVVVCQKTGLADRQQSPFEEAVRDACKAVEDGTPLDLAVTWAVARFERKSFSEQDPVKNAVKSTTKQDSNMKQIDLVFEAERRAVAVNKKTR